MPGSGKTTVAEALRARLEAGGTECVSRKELAADGSGFLRRHWQRALLIIGQAPRAARHYVWFARFVGRSRQSRQADAVKVLWNLWTVVALITRHRAKGRGVMILDQGLAQAIWSVGIGAAEGGAMPEAWEEVLTRLGPTDISFVVLRVRPAVARQRIAARAVPASRMERADWVAASERWAQAEHLCTSLAAGILRVAPPDARGISGALLELDTADTDPGALAAQILSRIFGHASVSEPVDPCRIPAASL